MKKTIAFLFHDTDYYSGGSRSLLDLIDSLRKEKELEILAIFPNNEGSAVDYINSYGIKIIVSEYYQISYLTDEGFLRHIYRLPRRLKQNVLNFINANQLSREVINQKVDIIYSNTGFILTGALLKRLNPSLKHIWHIREFGEEDHHFGVFLGRKFFYYMLNKYTDEVIFISHALENKFKSYIKKPNTHVIYDDVSPDYYQQIKTMYSYRSPLNISMAGLICEGKGQMEVIKALGLLKRKEIPITLNIAGLPVNKKYANDLKLIIEKEGLKNNVNFLGLVKDMNKLRSDNVFGVVASSSEAFGRVTIEGMLSGQLMIGSDAGATKELIANGVTGFLYKSHDYIELANLLFYLYSHPDVVNDVRKRGQLYAKKFIEHNCARQLLDIILRIE